MEHNELVLLTWQAVLDMELGIVALRVIKVHSVKDYRLDKWKHLDFHCADGIGVVSRRTNATPCNPMYPIWHLMLE